MRLCAWRALVALARKRSMNACRCAICALLLLVGRLLQRELLRALRSNCGVVARVGLELPLVDVDDLVDDGVEKLAVVRDEEQRAGIAREPVLEPEHGVEVEVVGRLVEQQQVRAAHQRLREIEAHAPAAGEAGDRLARARGSAKPRPAAASRRARAPCSRRSSSYR